MGFWDFLRNIFRRRPRRSEPEDTAPAPEPARRPTRQPQREPERAPEPIREPSPEPEPQETPGAPEERSPPRRETRTPNWAGRPREFTEEIIRPTLMELGAHTIAAERLLLGTAIAESNLVYRRQLGGGPALGLFQMEPATHQDIYDNYLRYNQDREQQVLAFLSSPRADRLEELVENDRYACAMARMHYLRRRERLPRSNDLDGQAAYWKRYYNTRLGAGTVEGYKREWMEVVGQFPPPF